MTTSPSSSGDYYVEIPPTGAASSRPRRPSALSRTTASLLALLVVGALALVCLRPQHNGEATNMLTAFGDGLIFLGGSSKRSRASSQVATKRKQNNAGGIAMLGAGKTPLVCSSAIEKHFPGSITGLCLDASLFKVMTMFGFDPTTTLVGTSTCPDEINRLTDRLCERWGNVDAFPLSGLAGVPFTGKTGFGAFGSHAPDNGALIIMFAPHIGFLESGTVGKLRRPGLSKPSGACGSIIGAWGAVKKRVEEGTDRPPLNHNDYQQGEVEKILENRYEEIANSPEPLVKATEVVYDEIKKRLLKMIPSDFPKPIGLIGGIQINTNRDTHRKGDGQDYFQPKDVLFKAGPGQGFVDRFNDFRNIILE